MPEISCIGDVLGRADAPHRNNHFRLAPVAVEIAAAGQCATQHRRIDRTGQMQLTRTLSFARAKAIDFVSEIIPALVAP